MCKVIYKKNWIVQFKWVNYRVCDYFNKAVFKNWQKTWTIYEREYLIGQQKKEKVSNLISSNQESIKHLQTCMHNEIPWFTHQNG